MLVSVGPCRVFFFLWSRGDDALGKLALTMYMPPVDIRHPEYSPTLHLLGRRVEKIKALHTILQFTGFSKSWNSRLWDLNNRIGQTRRASSRRGSNPNLQTLHMYSHTPLSEQFTKTAYLVESLIATTSPVPLLLVLWDQDYRSRAERAARPGSPDPRPL